MFEKTILFITLAALLALSAGCVAPPSDEEEDESSMPWNTPASWEGAPTIPGMNGQY